MAMKYIPNRHVKRVFPYEFYDELYERLTQFTPENVVFLLRDTEFENKLDDDVKSQFDNIRDIMLNDKNEEGTTLEEYNIYSELDQGEFLVLDTFIRREDRDKFIQKQPIDQFVLLVQLFDENQQPIFSKDGQLSKVRKLDAIETDHPDLAMMLMQVASADADNSLETHVELGVIQGPDHFIEKLVTDDSAERSDTYE